MTRGELMRYLDEEARRYNKKAMKSVARSRHMNELTEEDLAALKKNKELIRKFKEALLVDFLNYIAVGQCLDYGMYVKHLKEKIRRRK